MPKTISFTGGSDFDFEANDIARKRAMAEALLAKSQQGMPGTQMVSGIALRNSPLQGLAQLLQGYGANKQMEDLSRRERELGASKRADMAKAFESYNAMRQGGTSFAPPEGAEMGPVEAPGAFTQKKSDPRGAAMAAILSGHQPLQQLGMMDLQNASKGNDLRTQSELYRHFTPESILAHQEGRGQLTLLPKVSVSSGGVVAADRMGQPVSRTDLSMNDATKAKLGQGAERLRQSNENLAYATGRPQPMPQGSPVPRSAMRQSVSPEARDTQVAILRDELATAKDEETAIRTIRELNALGVKDLLSSPTFPKGVGNDSVSVAPPAQGAFPTKQGDAMALLQAKDRISRDKERREAQLKVDVDEAKKKNEKLSKSEGIGAALSQAEDLLSGIKRGPKGEALKGDLPTQSGIGAVVDKGAAIFGATPRGAKEADELNVVAGVLISKVPRFEGPQSDNDTKLYKQMAGDAGNRDLPVARRLAAVKKMRELYAGYETGAKGLILPEAAAPASSGTSGWRVVQ